MRTPNTSSLPADRPLGVAERFMWLMSRRFDNHATLTARVLGTTEVDRWRSALDALVRRHPLLTARVEDTRTGPHIRFGAHRAVPLRVRELSQSSWQDQLSVEMHTPLDGAEGPLLRVTLLHGPDSCVVILAGHHAVVDGLSFVHLTRDLLTLVSGGTPSGTPASDPVDPFIQEGVMAAAALLPPEPDIVPSDLPGTFRDGPGKQLLVSAAELTAGETAALRRWAREEKTTVNGAVAAAVLASGAALVPGWETRTLRVHTPIQLRQFLPSRAEGAEGVGNILAPATTGQPGTERDLGTAARSFTDGLAPFRETAAVMGSFALWGTVLGQGIGPAQMCDMLAAVAPHDVLLTNLGALDLPVRYGELTLDALWGPSVFFGFEGEHTVGVNTLDGVLRLLHTSWSPGPALADAVRDRLLEAIAR
ncbi:condensation domain-containing protein [Streptomyces sp. NPDC088747]|uniref:condensation domain-containing protein n=1 Tax=Streptomyces sp. NPDC088747 TaxID=3365886 RepID=UPI00382FCD4B